MVTPIQYSPPKDPYNVVFILFYFMSIGTLLPWNFFITVSGYWMYKFRTVDKHNVTQSQIVTSYSVESDGKNDLQIQFASDLAVAAQIPNVTVLILNGLFGHRFRTTPRLLVSLVFVVLLFLVTLSLVKVNTDSWQNEFLYITLACVVAINIFGATFQGGLLGLVGRFPPAYINAVLNGLAVGGTFAALVNILLLAVGGDDVSAAFYCFLIACVFLSGSVLAFFLVSRTPFYKFYMNEGVEPDVDERTPLVQVDSSSTPDIHVLDVLRRIHIPGVTVFLIYIVTLGCFPGLTVLIESTSRGLPDTTPWENDYFIPVTCFLFYNIGDYLGRMLSCTPALPTPGPRLVLLFSLLRLAFLPIFLLCNAAPLRREMTPIVFYSDGLYIAFMFMFSASNGYLTNICMVAAPQSVPPHLQQTASNLMVGILGLGLVVGSAISAVLVQFL